MGKKWILPPSDPKAVGALARELRISNPTACMLANRELSEPGAARDFLAPSLLALKDPAEDAGIGAAAAFLWEAVREGRRITVFGDYDADGICATAVLLKCLGGVGAHVDFYIPHRTREGYGLKCEALDRLKSRGAEVVVTVDCGITAHREADYAAELGIELVITDHHRPQDERPHARHVLDPELPECDFGYEHLAGVGVAFKLAWALGQAISGGPTVSEDYRPLMVDALPLVALGTVADMVPMRGENRVLTHYGLRALPHSPSPGLRALIEVAGVAEKSLRSHEVAFCLAPRLNAVGRMDDAAVAVEMLVTEDMRRASELAAYHDKQNRRRQSLQRAIFEEAHERVTREVDLGRPGCIVLASPDWHQGVVGLVASGLTEMFWRPSFVFRQEDGIVRGSARSIAGFPLFDAIQRCEKLLHRFGGHEGAAGLSMPLENLETFSARMSEIVAETVGEELPQPQLELEGEVSLGDLSTGVVSEIHRLSPFGKENPEPLFMARDLRLAGNPQLVGSTRRHLSFLVRQENVALRVIAFGKADWLPLLQERHDRDLLLAFEPILNKFRGDEKLELRAEDIQWAGEEDIELRLRAGA